MSEVFETQFTDTLVGLASLCLEYTDLSGCQPDTLWFYCYMEDGETNFLAFCQEKGKYLFMDQIGKPALLLQMLKLGVQDLLALQKLFAAHKRPVPTEIKVCCQVAAGTMDTQCNYDRVCPPDGTMTSTDAFLRWHASITNA